MKFSHQTTTLKVLTESYSTKYIVEQTGIKRTRLHHLIHGDYEMTLREAYLLGVTLKFNFFDAAYLEKHFYGNNLPI